MYWLKNVGKGTAVVLLLCTVVNATANIRINSLLQSNMVLQRDKPCPIWGTADKGEQVTIVFHNLRFTTKAGNNGNWTITLPAQPAGGPHQLLISGSNTIELNNVLFGDVWICGGQSNMQFRVEEMNNHSIDTSRYRNSNIRMLTITTATDYVPQDTIKGGTWHTATPQTVAAFSAAGFFFGESVQQQINVPIGLISDNLGGTAVETWMSNAAIARFPQFAGYYNQHLAPGKSFQQLNDAFEKLKPSWKKNYYLANDPGLAQQWYLPQTDTAGWKPTAELGYWEDNLLPNYDGSVWFRRSFDLPDNYDKKGVGLGFGRIDDYAMVWVNGKLIAEVYGSLNIHGFTAPDSLLQPTNNALVVRVFDAGGKGGMYNFWWFPKWASHQWLYKPGVRINAAEFPKPNIPNATLGNSPAILYNANIAPVTKLAIKGIIWYQGESNADRAEEYAQLFPAMIQDWRNHFRQGDVPFLFVQLANYNADNHPDGESWAELREAQAKTRSLPNTGMATAIDIGEATDIHPKNKVEVGRRLGLLALKIAYGKDTTHESPAIVSSRVLNDSLIVTVSDSLATKDKYGYIRGFRIAGQDGTFHWAKASLQNPRTIVVYSSDVKNPLAVRYAWSNNPGALDLYNHQGWPLLPFRTDSLQGRTAGKMYTDSE